MKITKKIQEAMIKSAILHKDQKRKEGDVPFIVHPYSVAVIVSNYTDEEDIIVGALLHDVLEDVPGYYESDMIRDFGEKVTEIVKGVSEEKDPNDRNQNEKETWLYRKKKYLEGLRKDSKESLMVSAADKIHNLNSIMDAYQKRGEESFKNFNSTIEERLWFSGEVLNILKERLDNKIVIELEDRYKEAEEFFNFFKGAKTIQIMGQKKPKEEKKENSDLLVDWLRDAEQIPEEGETVDEFIKRTGWTLEEENKERKATGEPLLENREEYKKLFEE